MAKHQNLSSPYSVHPFAFTSNADPASDASIDMAPYKGWINTGSSNLLKVRNAANGAWENVSVAGAATTPAFGSNSASVTTYNDNAGTLTAANAHHHIGVTSIAHTSNTFSGPVTIVAGANIGISSSAPGTYRIDGSAAAGGGAGSTSFVGAKVNNAGTQSISNDTVTAVTFNAEEFDTDAYHSTVSNTSRMTIPSGKGGKYHVLGGTRCAGSTLWTVAIGVNGTRIRSQTAFPTASDVQTSAYVSVVAGDYIELLVHQNSGGALDVGHATTAFIQSHLAVYYLGA